MTTYQTTGTQQGDINAGLISGGVYNPNGVITPTTLTNQNPLSITDPTPTYVTPPLTLTPQEQQYSDLTQKVQGENTALAGKTGYQLQQNESAGVNTAQANINDLNAQLLGLTNEAKAIPYQLQNDSIGKGITTGVLNTMTDAQLRTNAIKALNVSTLLAASQGQLANAKALADRAVEARFGQIEAQRDANIKNLELIKSDPTTTLQEKNRANSLIATQEKAKQEDATKKEEAKQIWDVATTAATNANGFTPSGQYQTLSQTLKAISEAPTKEEALAIASSTGLVVAPTADKYTLTKDAAGNPLIFNSTTGKFENGVKNPVTGITTVTGSGNPVVSTVGGKGVIAGVKVDPSIANDVEAVLSGRNTLYNIRQTMGRTNAAAAYMQKMRDTITKIDPEFDFIASDAGGKFVSSTFYQKAISAITSVEPNIDKAVELSNQVTRLGVKGVDAILQKSQIQLGNETVTNFHQAQKLIADEIGLALGQGTVSDMKLQLGFDVTDPNVKPEVFASNMALVKEFIANRKDALNNQRYSSSVSTSQAQGTIPGPDVSALTSFVQSAIKDIKNYASREALIADIKKNNPSYDQKDIEKIVYGTWKDNTTR